MSVPTDGDENPYRFAPGVQEATTNAPRIYRSTTPHDLRSIARRRRLLALMMLALLGSIALLAIAGAGWIRVAIAIDAGSAATELRREREVYGLLAMAGGGGIAVALIAIFTIGRRLLETTDAPQIDQKTLGLLIPGLNVFVAVGILRDARKTLEARGVIVGWLACDYSMSDAQWVEFARRSASRGSVLSEVDPYFVLATAPAELIDASQPRGWRTLRDLKALAASRFAIWVFLGAQVTGALLMHAGFMFDSASRIVIFVNRAANEMTLLEGVATMAILAYGIGAVGTLVSGIRVMDILSSTLREQLILCLLIPGVNVVVSVMILREAKQALEAQGVRVGWLTCDYSQAIVEEFPQE